MALGNTTAVMSKVVIVLTNSSLPEITVVSSPTCFRKYCHSNSKSTSKNHLSAVTPGGFSAL
jgi:hypothetical protein